MTVEDVFDHAKYGELSQLGVVKNLTSSDQTKVNAAAKQVLSYLNMGLIELYKRFSLRTEETVITMLNSQTIYEISAQGVIDGYLSAYPGDYNGVIAAYNEVGDEYPINEEEEPLSIMTPSWNTVQIPNPVTGEGVYLIYSAAPDRVVWDTIGATDLDKYTNTLAKVVSIPPVMLEALLLYIGYRGHGTRDSNINTENNTHLMRFEASCNRILAEGHITQEGLKRTRSLEDKGFV